MYDLAKHFSYNRKEILGKIKSVLHKGILELGSEVERFEENFSKSKSRPSSASSF